MVIRDALGTCWQFSQGDDLGACCSRKQDFEVGKKGDKGVVHQAWWGTCLELPRGVSQAGLEYSWKLPDGNSGSEACHRQEVLAYLWPLCLVEVGGGSLHSLSLSFQKVMSHPHPTYPEARPQPASLGSLDLSRRR